MSQRDDHFRDWVARNFVALQNLFAKGGRSGDRQAFQEMGKLIGEYAVLGTPRGERVTGAEAIGLFFEDMWRDGKSDVEFELKHLSVVPTIDPIRMKKPADMVVEVGYYITEFRLKGNPSTLTGAWCATAKHIGGCPINP